jgi:hypothetical protein
MNTDIILENKHFCLTLGGDCCAKSLVHKASGQECLDTREDVALFSVTQPRPYNNEIKLAYPNKRTTFQANRVRMEGDRLIVGFEIIHYEAEITVTVTDDYISFRLAGFIIHPGDFSPHVSATTAPAESFRLLQLPIKNRANFGQWLNVSWDEEVAVNVLATSPYAIIDAENRKDFRIFTADALKLSLILVPFMFAGLFSGMLLCRRINETMIRRIVVVLLILSGIALIPGNF